MHTSLKHTQSTLPTPNNKYNLSDLLIVLFFFFRRKGGSAELLLNIEVYQSVMFECLGPIKLS